MDAGWAVLTPALCDHKGNSQFQDSHKWFLYHNHNPLDNIQNHHCHHQSNHCHRHHHAQGYCNSSEMSLTRLPGVKSLTRLTLPPSLYRHHIPHHSCQEIIIIIVTQKIVLPSNTITPARITIQQGHLRIWVCSKTSDPPSLTVSAPYSSPSSSKFLSRNHHHHH